MHTAKEMLLLLVEVEGAARDTVGKLRISILGNYGLKINNCGRGQTLMTGKGGKQVQRRQSHISSLNDPALFVPSTAHNFNLLLCKAVSLVLHG